MTQYNEALIWSAIHCEEHPSLVDDEKKIAGLIPLINELFPGINYFSLTGFYQVMTDYLQPTLSKLFPDLVKKSAQDVSRDRKVDVEKFLPSNGYEHSDNPSWKKRLDELLQ